MRMVTSNAFFKPRGEVILGVTYAHWAFELDAGQMITDITHMITATNGTNATTCKKLTAETEGKVREQLALWKKGGGMTR